VDLTDVTKISFLEISGIPAGAMTGNGTNAVEISADLIAEFVANGVYGPFEIAVFDPEAMNNSCWHGDFMLEDKLAPVFDCDNDVTIACTTDNAPSTATNPAGAVSWVQNLERLSDSNQLRHSQLILLILVDCHWVL
jgi:hypothetical protein